MIGSVRARAIARATSTFSGRIEHAYASTQFELQHAVGEGSPDTRTIESIMPGDGQGPSHPATPVFVSAALELALRSCPLRSPVLPMQSATDYRVGLVVISCPDRHPVSAGMAHVPTVHVHDHGAVRSTLGRCPRRRLVAWAGNAGGRHQSGCDCQNSQEQAHMCLHRAIINQ